MGKDRIQEYLHVLKGEFHRQGFFDPETLSEIESHLLDSADAEIRAGLPPIEAQEKALERFGSPRQTATIFSKEKHFMRQKILLACSVVLGLLIAFIDSRPTWDDTGITVIALLAGGAIIGLLLQKRPWLFALAFGLWLPLWEAIVGHDPKMFIVLIFPFIGVYAGWAIRQVSRKVLQNH